MTGYLPHARRSASANRAGLWLCVWAALGTSCGGTSPRVREDADRIAEIQRLQDENARLRLETARKSDQLQEQEKLVESLRGLEGERAIERIVHVDRIDVDRLSGGYDDNHDGVDDGIVVYLILFDQFGGAMRASGSASVTLVDMTSPGKPAVLNEVHVSADDLPRMWYGAFLTTQYTIKAPWKEGTVRPPAGRITAVVNFTDLLTGRSFQSQRVVSVTGYATTNSTPTSR